MQRLDGEWSGHLDGERSVELRGLEGHHRLYSVAWGRAPNPRQPRGSSAEVAPRELHQREQHGPEDDEYQDRKQGERLTLAIVELGVQAAIDALA